MIINCGINSSRLLVDRLKEDTECLLRVFEADGQGGSPSNHQNPKKPSINSELCTLMVQAMIAYIHHKTMRYVCKGHNESSLGMTSQKSKHAP